MNETGYSAEPTSTLPEVQIDSYGLTIPKGMSLIEYLDLGERKIRPLSRIYESTPYAVGDYINYGADHWPEQYAQALSEDGYTESTLNRWAYICRHVSREIRQLAPSHTHCYHVARLPKPEQKKMLTLVNKEGLTARELQATVKENYPNEGEKRGRKPKEKLTFEIWLEQYFLENNMSTEPGKEETYVAPEIVNLMQEAWKAGGGQ